MVCSGYAAPSWAASCDLSPFKPERRRAIDNVPHDIAAILRLIPQLAGPATVTPLTGGITNLNYRVEAGGNVYVLRIAGENTWRKPASTATANTPVPRPQPPRELSPRQEVIAYLPERRDAGAVSHRPGFISRGRA